MSDQVTRFNKIGVSGRRAEGRTKTDAYIQTLTIPIASVASATAQDSGLALPAKTSVIDVVVNKLSPSTAGTTPTISLGTIGGTNTSLLAAIATTGTGFAGSTTSTRIYNTGANVSFTFGSADVVGFVGEAVITLIGSD